MPVLSALRPVGRFRWLSRAALAVGSGLRDQAAGWDYQEAPGDGSPRGKAAGRGFRGCAAAEFLKVPTREIGLGKVGRLVMNGRPEYRHVGR